MTKQADLIAYLFEGLPHRDDPAAARLSGELMQWMDASTRFTAFVETYRDKIRKKIRVAREAENILDLRSELDVAAGLLGDSRMAAAYEPYASAKRRGPDFSVTYRANLVFNIEVARIRVDDAEPGGAEPGGAEPGGSEPGSLEPGSLEPGSFDLARKEERILRILLDKLGQMQPSMPNLLVIHTRADLAQSIELNRLMQEIKARAEGKDPAFYAASRYASPAGFYKDFLLLSGILLWAPAPAGQVWVNKQARPALDEKVIRAVSSAARG